MCYQRKKRGDLREDEKMSSAVTVMKTKTEGQIDVFLIVQIRKDQALNVVWQTLCPSINIYTVSTVCITERKAKKMPQLGNEFSCENCLVGKSLEWTAVWEATRKINIMTNIIQQDFFYITYLFWGTLCKSAHTLSPFPHFDALRPQHGFDLARILCDPPTQCDT